MSQYRYKCLSTYDTIVIFTRVDTNLPIRSKDCQVFDQFDVGCCSLKFHLYRLARAKHVALMLNNTYKTWNNPTGFSLSSWLLCGYFASEIPQPNEHDQVD